MSTVSNLKLDDVFSDVFGKSSRSITEQILQHPGETFDVAPFVHGRCKTPIEEIQAAVDGAISREQAVKLRQCLDHIDELNKHISEVEREILCLSDKYEAALNLIRTVPGFNKNPMTAIQVLSQIGCDMSVFPTDKHLVWIIRRSGSKGRSGILKNQESRAEFLHHKDHRIRIVYTPKHCSWMNQIEIWFGIINRRLLKRKSYRSIEELKASILRFVEQYNVMAKPFKWTYKGVPLTV